MIASGASSYVGLTDRILIRSVKCPKVQGRAVLTQLRACACQTALIQLFPDVCALLCSPSISVSSPPCVLISRWPPPLHPALIWVFLSYTSCLSSALYWHEAERPPLALPSVTGAETVVFVPFAQTTLGRLEMRRVVCRPRLHCKNFLKMEKHHETC